MHQQTSLLRSKKLPRKDAWTLIAGSLFGLGRLLIDDKQLGFGTIGVVACTLFAALVLIAGLLHLLPARYWQYGITMKEDGFVFHHQLRKSRFIRYQAITRIVAYVILDAEGDPSCTLQVKSLDGNASLDEPILYGSTILDVLKSLPGFDHAAWAKSSAPQQKRPWISITKKTLLFERKRGV